MYDSCKSNFESDKSFFFTYFDAKKLENETSKYFFLKMVENQ